MREVGRITVLRNKEIYLNLLVERLKINETLLYVKESGENTFTSHLNGHLVILSCGIHVKSGPVMNQYEKYYNLGLLCPL
jgi:hypothetical protein